MFIVLSFLLGVLLSALIMQIVMSKRVMSLKEENISLKSRCNSSESLVEIIKNDFVKLANETIKKEQEDLRRQNREVLDDKLLPLSKELAEFKAKVENFNVSGVENTTKILEQISNLEKNNKTIADEAKNLTEALTKNQNVKGSYGENVLDMVLKSCGMVEGIHYSKQFSTYSENLKDNQEHLIRPDIVINLPDDRHLIIDSKVTLTSYLEYLNDNTKLREFKSEVKKRIKDLSNKNYQNAENLLQPDFVLMYMPVENSVSLLYEDFEIIEMAFNANIIIVGTSSLLTTIRLVNQIFAQQKQMSNINNIVLAGTNLYETFVLFCNDLLDIQKKILDVNKNLTTSINRFKRDNNGKPSLFKEVEKLKEYGITTSKQVPVEMLEYNEKKEAIEND